jgi:hypothetical protein
MTNCINEVYKYVVKTIHYALFFAPLHLCAKQNSYSTQSTNFTSPHGKVIKAIFQQNKQPQELCKNGYQLSVSVKMV